RDFHTARDVIRADGSGRQETVVSHRFYLADADFLVALEGKRELLNRLNAALQHPVWPLYLGRKAFVPGVPVWLPDGLHPESELGEALVSYPLRLPRHNASHNLRLVLEDEHGPEVRPDVPLSFSARTFTTRRVRTELLETASLPQLLEDSPCS